MPLDRPVAFVGIDEIQLAADRERGHIFTDRLLHARGTSETMFMGAETASRWIRTLVPGTEFIQRPRFSSLSYVGPQQADAPAAALGDGRLLRRRCLCDRRAHPPPARRRRHRHGRARARARATPQVELYESGEVDYLVATDAIGMGLNMDVQHVAFAIPAQVRRHHAAAADQGRDRPDRRPRRARIWRTALSAPPAEVGPMDPEIVEAVENHRFDPLRHLMWRNSRLDFRSVITLQRSLQERPPVHGLIRQGSAEDHQALELLVARIPSWRSSRSGASASSCSGKSARSPTSAS